MENGVASVIDEVIDNPVRFATMNNEQVYTMPVEDVDRFQLSWLQRRFDEMRPRVKVLDRLASDLNIDRIENFEDAPSLFLPHTFYKSYPVSFVEKKQYAKLSAWMSTLSTIDLTGIDVSGCRSLDDWLNALMAATPFRPLCSSGTGGKISFFPRTTAEEYVFLQNYYLFNGGFRGELDSELGTGKIDYFTPWPVSSGRHNLPVLFNLLREQLYKGRNGEHVHTLGQGHWSADMLWLSGRLRAAERKGEEIELSPEIEALRGQLAADARATTENIDPFIHELIDGQRGKKVFLFATPKELYSLALACRERGLKAEFAPDAYIFSPGRPQSKGHVMPDSWLEECKEVFPYPYQGVYGMTESTGHARLCAAGNYHMPPWVFLALLDPDTGAPFPRSGVQTGRLALFDMLATSYWGGAISGDRATIDWRGGCGCGRVGPFIHDDVVRYMNLRDDDKITCAKSADAYDKTVNFVLGEVD